jgi:hypothetical protein
MKILVSVKRVMDYNVTSGRRWSTRSSRASSAGPV